MQNRRVIAHSPRQYGCLKFAATLKLCASETNVQLKGPMGTVSGSAGVMGAGVNSSEGRGSSPRKTSRVAGEMPSHITNAAIQRAENHNEQKHTRLSPVTD